MKENTAQLIAVGRSLSADLFFGKFPTINHRLFFYLLYSPHLWSAPWKNQPKVNRESNSVSASQYLATEVGAGGENPNPSVFPSPCNCNEKLRGPQTVNTLFFWGPISPSQEREAGLEGSTHHLSSLPPSLPCVWSCLNLRANKRQVDRGDVSSQTCQAPIQT